MLWVPDILRWPAATGLGMMADWFRVGSIWADSINMLLKNWLPFGVNTLSHVTWYREMDYSIDPDTPNIMMLPGILSGIRTYYPIISEVKEYGIDTIDMSAFPEYIWAILNFERIIESAKRWLEVAYASPVEWLIDLVGHSRWGLVALLMKILDEENPDPNRIGKVITCFSPLAGTLLTRILQAYRLGWAIGDMHPESKIIQDDVKNYAHHITLNLIAGEDRIVPKEDASVPWVQEEKTIKNAGHLDFSCGRQNIQEEIGYEVANALYN